MFSYSSLGQSVAKRRTYKAAESAGKRKDLKERSRQLTEEGWILRDSDEKAAQEIRTGNSTEMRDLGNQSLGPCFVGGRS